MEEEIEKENERKDIQQIWRKTRNGLNKDSCQVQLKSTWKN